jgi:hypothetical protein
MSNNLCIIHGGYCDCSCTSGDFQITPAVLRMNIHKNPASLRLSLGFPHWLGDSPRCSQTYHKISHGAPGPVIRDPSYSKGRSECPPRVRYSPEIDASMFTLHIVSDTPGGSQRRKFNLLMWGWFRIASLSQLHNAFPHCWSVFLLLRVRNWAFWGFLLGSEVCNRANASDWWYSDYWEEASPPMQPLHVGSYHCKPLVGIGIT